MWFLYLRLYYFYSLKASSGLYVARVGMGNDKYCKNGSWYGGSHGGREVAVRALDMRACIRIHEILIAVLFLTSTHISLLQLASVFSVLFTYLLVWALSFLINQYYAILGDN